MASFRGAIARRGFPSKPGSDPIQLISQGPVDHGIVPETRIDVPLNMCPRTAKALKDFLAGNVRKQEVLAATHQLARGHKSPAFPAGLAQHVEVGVAAFRS